MNRREFAKGAFAIPAMLLGLAEPSEATQRRRLFQRSQRGIRSRRWGCATFSCEMIESLAPESYRAMHRAEHDPTPEVLDDLRKALLLPDNCRIDAVSPHYLLRQRQIALRIECEDFPETPEGCMIPNVEPWYTIGSDWLPRFSGWSEPAIRNVCKGA